MVIYVIPAPIQQQSMIVDLAAAFGIIIVVLASMNALTCKRNTAL
jgi:hypothetical protein